MNLKIREFKMSLETYIESADIPVEVKKMVLKELYEDATKKSDEAVMEEIKERDKAEKEEKQDE